MATEPLNTETILAWATGGWNDCHSTSYPQISTDPALTIDESNIYEWNLAVSVYNYVVYSVMLLCWPNNTTFIADCRLAYTFKY